LRPLHKINESDYGTKIDDSDMFKYVKS